MDTNNINSLQIFGEIFFLSIYRLPIQMRLVMPTQ